MENPSDVSPIIESIAVYFSYITGATSLFVNSVALVIMLWKASILDRKIKILTIFFQVSCLLQNVFLTIHSLCAATAWASSAGSFHIRICWLVINCDKNEYTREIQTIFVFFSMVMISAFGVVIIARHQMLLFEGSKLKLNSRLTKLVQFLEVLFFQCVSLCAALSSRTDGQIQTAILDRRHHFKDAFSKYNSVVPTATVARQIGGLDWYLFDGAGSPKVWWFVVIGTNVSLPMGCLLGFLPLAHMIHIVRRAGRRVQGRQKKIECTCAMRKPCLTSCSVLHTSSVQTSESARDNVYAPSRHRKAAAVALSSCSTLAPNSVVLVTRNRRGVRNGEAP
uniref:G protein-coupled receptor n=1 Tax=Pristionchus pacificus TaxID=54126 RepID=A0A8R1UG44_PRIPA